MQKLPWKESVKNCIGTQNTMCMKEKREAFWDLKELVKHFSSERNNTGSVAIIE